MYISLQRGLDVGMSQPDLYVLHISPGFNQDGGMSVTKLVEATNGHFLVEAENEIWYDIARGYSLHCSLF